MLDEDFENEIPVVNLQFSQGSSELRIKTVKHNNGYRETNIERLKVHPPVKQICVTRPLTRRPVANTVCLSIEDVKRAVAVEDFWEVGGHLRFRRVYVYGKVDVLNQFTKDHKTVFKFSIDDGTAEILATLSVTKEAKQSCKSATFTVRAIRISR